MMIPFMIKDIVFNKLLKNVSSKKLKVYKCSFWDNVFIFFKSVQLSHWHNQITNSKSVLTRNFENFWVIFLTFSQDICSTVCATKRNDDSFVFYGPQLKRDLANIKYHQTFNRLWYISTTPNTTKKNCSGSN